MVRDIPDGLFPIREPLPSFFESIAETPVHGTAYAAISSSEEAAEKASVAMRLCYLIYKREPQADPEDGITVQTMAWTDLKTAMMLQATSKLVWGYLSHLEEPPRNRHLQKTEQLRPPQRAANTVQTARRWLLLPRFQYARIVVLSDSGLGHSTRFA